MIQKIIVFLLSFVFLLAGVACADYTDTGTSDSVSVSQSEETEKAVNRVRFSRIPEGVERYDAVKVYVGETELPLYSVQVNTSQSWTPNQYKRKPNGVGLLELEGKVTLTIVPNVQLNYSTVVRPLSANVVTVADVAANKLYVTLRSSGEYVVEINGDKYDAVHLFVSDYGSFPDTAAYRNVMIFEAGLHTSANDSRISKAQNAVNVPSDTLVWLRDGAVVRAKFSADRANHIAIVGRGVIDGSTFDRDASSEHYTVTVPIDCNHCTDVLLSDFSVLDPAGWTVNFYFIENARIDDIKIISSRSNGDGISLQSCKNIEVTGCFVRTWDDSLVVKNYPRWENRSEQGATKHIRFADCTVWTDLAQCMEVGYETVGKELTDVAFENITVLHALHNAVMSIHNANNADVKDVRWKDITVEDGYSTTGTLLEVRVQFHSTWSVNHTITELGSVSSVSVENVKVISAKSIVFVLGGSYDTRSGYQGAHYVDGVFISGVSLAGKTVPEGKYVLKDCGYLENFSYRMAESVTGASFSFSASAEDLAAYGEKTEVEVL